MRGTDENILFNGLPFVAIRSPAPLAPLILYARRRWPRLLSHPRKKKQFQTIVEFAASLLSLLAADGFFRYLRKNAVSENVVSFLPPYDSAGKIVGEES